MRIQTVLSGLAATAFSLALSATAIAAPAPVQTPTAAPAAVPAVFTVDGLSCPAVPAGLTSENTQKLALILTDACILNATGKMDDGEYTMIRQRVFEALFAEAEAENAVRSQRATAGTR